MHAHSRISNHVSNHISNYVSNHVGNHAGNCADHLSKSRFSQKIRAKFATGFAVFSSALLLSLAGSPGLAQAHDFKLGEIVIDHPYSRPTVPQQSTGAAYFALNNQGKSDDKLIGVTSKVAQSTEIHSMELVGDIMKMRSVDSIALSPGGTVKMKPGGGYHVMLIGLKQPLKAGDKFPLELTFEKNGKIGVMVFVEDEKTAAAHEEHMH